MKTEFYRNKKVVVTGGAGFIGSNLVIELVRLGADVMVIDSMIDNYGGNLYNLRDVGNKIRINFSDIRDSFTLPYLLKDVDIIFSLAGQVSHIESMNEPYIDLEINCTSQLTLLRTCLKQKERPKIVFASTRQIYGTPEYLPVDEKHPTNPTDINGIHKLAGEMYYKLFHRLYDFPTVILRLTNTYGPRMMIRENKQGFLPIWIGQALKGKTIKIFGTGEQRRDFNYISDVIDALLISGENDALVGKAFNLGHHANYSLLDVIAMIKNIREISHDIIPFPASHKKIDIGDYYSDYGEFKKQAKWIPRIDLQEGLKRTFHYYEKCREHYL